MPKEPETSLLFRVGIINYEIGDVTKSIVYAERFPDDRDMYLSQAAQYMGNVLVQLELLCKALGITLPAALEDGREHLRERYQEFEKDGWQPA